MGCYDTLGGECPSCKEDTEEQTKAFHCLMSSYPKGDMVAGAPEHEFTIELDDCYKCEGPLFAGFKHRKFIGFFTYPYSPVLYSDKSRREELVKIIENMQKTFEAKKKEK